MERINNKSTAIVVYFVCAELINTSDQWLSTPFIQRQNVPMVHIELEFTIVDCFTRNTSTPQAAKNCKETFNLYYYESINEKDCGAWTAVPKGGLVSGNVKCHGREIGWHGGDANSEHDVPQWDPNKLQKISKVTGEGMNSDQGGEYKNKRHFDTKLLTKNGFYVVFRDQGSCSTVYHLRISYKFCTKIVEHLASYPQTTAAHEIIEKVEGKCVDHAESVMTPVNHCRKDGFWYNTYDKASRPCHCVGGFEEIGATCRACAMGRYREKRSAPVCIPCPRNSLSTTVGSFMCPCISGYYRAKLDRPDISCIQPSGPPRNLTKRVERMVVTLSWQAPRTSYFGSVKYELHCDICNHDVVYKPGKFTTVNNVTISNLAPQLSYEFRVYARNKVSALAALEDQQMNLVNYAQIKVKTGMAVLVRHLRISNLTANSVFLKWDKPADYVGKIPTYTVRTLAQSVHQDNYEDIKTTLTSVKISNLDVDHDYAFQVAADVPGGNGRFCDPVSTRQSSSRNADDVTSKSLHVAIIASVVAVVLLLIIVIVIILIAVIRRKGYKSIMDEKRNILLEFSNTESRFHSNGIRPYVDPSNYEDVDQAVKEFAREIDGVNISIDRTIGEGEFADVYSGTLSTNSGNKPVAIKTLKVDSSARNIRDFLVEASIMGQFSNANVIYLEGVVTKSHPVMIVTEYMENGALDLFLKGNDGRFTSIQLVGMLRGVASGMDYLASMKYVHRDLAGRNILVSSQLVCKVADFGLSRAVEEDNNHEYTTKGGKVPVRWTAPEAIAYRKFTSSSDVWSYGIVCWEAMSYGERPYWDWSNRDVVKAVEEGYRLPSPIECPSILYQVMFDCWRSDRAQRPTFSEIKVRLDKAIRSPACLSVVATNRHRYSCAENDISIDTTVYEWLHHLKMDRYKLTFSDFHFVSELLDFGPSNFENLGVSLVGHRKKFLNSIQCLRAQRSMCLITPLDCDQVNA